jgi:protein SCO1
VSGAVLRVVLNQLGAQASRVQIVAISVDPGGDTTTAVGHFLHAHEMVGRMQYLIGSSAQLSRTWAAWSVGSAREAGQPDLVAHSALVYGISASGRLTTIYPATFEPAQIVHDVPRLAAG